MQVSGKAGPSKQPLSRATLSDLVPARIFGEAIKQDNVQVAGGPKQMTSICFEDTGRTCVTAGEDDMFTYWDVLSGKRTQYFASFKYGVDHVTATHERGMILHASTRENDDVRYHSAEDNKYIKYFKGHTSKVCSISMHPKNNTFLTGSHDGTVMLWDMRANAAKGKLNQLNGPCLTDWDPTGTVWAVALPDSHHICLYAANSFDQAPFCHATINDPELDKIASPRRNPYMTSVTFSNNGKYLLVGTSGVFHYVLDSYDLKPVARLKGHVGLEKDKQGEMNVKPGRGLSGHEVCWTPDSTFVMSGSHDGRICIWDLSPPPGQDSLPVQPARDANSPNPIQTFEPCAVLNEEKLGGPSRVVAMSPRYMMAVTGGENVCMWLPLKKDGQEDDGDAMDET